MIEIQAPNPMPESNLPKIFLGGSIEMGNAEPWQERVIEALFGTESVILNPRRAVWDSRSAPTSDNLEFKNQVEWELDALERSDHILFYFDPETKSPITLLELGLYARSGKLLLVCREGFWRKGNVDIVAEKYEIETFQSLDDAVIRLKELIED